MPTRSFGTAGTKDKRGVTTQRCTVFRVQPDQLRNLNRKLNGIKLGNFKFVNERLGLGDLKGNKFVVVLRDVRDPIERVSKAVEELKNGFINYYG